jgi:HAD superfamily hydrolase (TIGR01509 family)
MIDVDALLLDMDGTLVDSNAAVERAWTTWSSDVGVDAADVLLIAHGSPAEVTVRRLFPDLSDGEVSELAARQLNLQYEDLEDVVVLPGALELIAAAGARSMPWAVVTSADIRLARARLAVTGIAPPVLVTAEDITNGKPDPDAFLRAATLLGVPIERCLVVEDSEPGVAAGRASGAMVAALNDLAGDLVIADLHELGRLLFD